MSRPWVFALAAAVFVAGMAWRYFGAGYMLTYPEQSFANRALDCVGPAGEPLGKMVLTPITPGQQFKITIDGQDTIFDLAAQPHFSDIFESASGSQIILDQRMRFTGLFGGKTGACGPSGN